MQAFFSLTSRPLSETFQYSLENYPSKNNCSEMENLLADVNIIKLLTYKASASFWLSLYSGCIFLTFLRLISSRKSLNNLEFLWTP